MQSIIKATVGTLNISASVKRVEINSSGPITSCIIDLNDNGNASKLPQVRAGAAVTVTVNNEQTNNQDRIMFQGFIDDIPGKDGNHRVFSDRQAQITCLSISRDLLRHLLPATPETVFKNARIGDILRKPLRLTNSEIDTPTTVENGKEINLADSTLGNPIVELLEPNDRYFVDLYDEACEKVGYGYTVNWFTKHLNFWNLNNTPSYNTLLRLILGSSENNILSANNDEVVSSSVINHIIIKASGLNDHWTEYTASALTPKNNTVQLFDDTQNFAVGKASIKVQCTNSYYISDTESNTGIMYFEGPTVNFNFPLFNTQVLDVSNIPTVNCSVNVTHDRVVTLKPDAVTFFISLTDDVGHTIYWYEHDFVRINGAWCKKFNFAIGYNAPKREGTLLKQQDKVWFKLFQDGNWNITEHFTWRITSLKIGMMPIRGIGGTVTGSGNFTGNFWIDGLYIPSEAAKPMVQAIDQNSINSYGRHMISYNRHDLKSMIEMQKVADNILAAGKDPYKKVSLITKLQPDMLFAGLISDVRVPHLAISTGTNGVNPLKHRVVNIQHIIEPGADVCRGYDSCSKFEMIRSDLSDNPLVTARRILQSSNYSLAGYLSNEKRISVLENQQITPEAAAAAGGAGGSSVDWDNVPYINLQSNLHMVQADSTSDPKQLIEIWNKPYIIDPNKWDTKQKGDMTMYLRSHDAIAAGLHDYNLPDSSHIAFVSQNDFNHADGNQLGTTTYLSQVDILSGGTGIACSHHFYIRKDLMMNGMINTLEGAIVLHGGKYRRWLNYNHQPTIYSGGLQSEYNSIYFKNFMTDGFIPIRMEGIIDKNGNQGDVGQTLCKDAGGGMIWTHKVIGGTLTTNASGYRDIRYSDYGASFNYTPSIVCTFAAAQESNRWVVSFVITNATASGCRVYAVMVNPAGGSNIDVQCSFNWIATGR